MSCPGESTWTQLVALLQDAGCGLRDVSAPWTSAGRRPGQKQLHPCPGFYQRKVLPLPRGRSTVPQPWPSPSSPSPWPHAPAGTWRPPVWRLGWEGSGRDGHLRLCPHPCLCIPPGTRPPAAPPAAEAGSPHGPRTWLAARMFVAPRVQLRNFCSVVQEDSAARARCAVCGLWRVAEGPEVPRTISPW